MSAKNITKTLLIFSCAVLIFGVGFKLGKSNNDYTDPQLSKNIPFRNADSSKDGGRDLDFSLFWQAWDELENKFIDNTKIDKQKMYYGAIKGMVAALDDPYTFFLTPEENKASKNDLAGKFEGIGAQLGLQDNRIVVVAPLKNSPAIKANIKSGDFINEVDGISTKGWSLPQTVSKIRGPKGSTVKLGLERNNKEFEVTIVRDQINVDSVELSFENKKGKSIAILKLNQFGDNTNKEWDKAISDISLKWQKKEIVGMVLDLRDNPGGYLDSAVYLAEDFLDRGKLIVKQESSTQENKNYTVQRNGNLINIPLVILINKGSASASEILAGAIRDYKRAKLVGEKSFGKGSVQEATSLRDGAGIHITVAKWILPKGDWINSKGIEPDIKIENKNIEGSTLKREADSQLDKAIEQLLK